MAAHLVIFLAFYGNRTSITTFTNLSLFHYLRHMNPIMLSHSTTAKLTLKLFSFLHCSLSSAVYPSGLLTINVPVFLFFPMSAAQPVHLICFD